MTIVDVLEQNSRSYGDEVCLVEINPEVKEVRRVWNGCRFILEF